MADSGKSDRWKSSGPQSGESLQAFLEREIARHGSRSMAEPGEIVDRLIDAYNTAPRDELGGLSPAQVAELIHADWVSPKSAFRLDHDLSLDEVAKAEVFQHARMMLEYVAERDKIKLTAKGNLDRKTVEELLQSMISMDEDLESVKRYYRVLNEENVWPIKVLRFVLEQMRLLRKQKGVLHVTKKSRDLCQDENAGKLFALLFEGYMTKLDLSSLGRLPNYPHVQGTIGYSLYKLSIEARNWVPVENLNSRILLPEVEAEITSRGFPNHVKYVCRSRIIYPLLRFALLEGQYEQNSMDFLELRRVRKTRLFNTFVRFGVHL